MKEKFWVYLGLAMLVWMAAIGIKMQQTQTSRTDKLQVTATFYPLAEFARQTGGNLIEVTTIVPAGTEPHDFEPTIQQTAGIYRAGLFIYNGGGIDNWAGKLAGKLPPHRVLKMVTERADPHTWLDPILAASEAGRIGQALEKLDPGHAKQYAANTRKFQTELNWLDRQFKMVLTNCRHREIITTHEAFAYLAHRYNLKINAIAGISPEEEPSPGKMAEIAQLVKNTGMNFIFLETLASPKIAQAIAQETGAQILTLNPLEGITPEEAAAGADYISVQQMNLNNLKIALVCL